MAKKFPSVAIIGVSALFPGMDRGNFGAGKFWRDIFHGRDFITEVPPKRWRIDDYYDPDKSKRGKTYAKRGAFLNPTAFDPLAFGVPPNVISQTDTAQLLALIVAQQVLEDACLGGVGGIDLQNRDKMSVILGVTAGQELMNEMAASLQRPVWQKSLREAGLPENLVQDACDRIELHYTNWEENTFPGLLGNVVAGRIANRFNLAGTNCVTDAACASALSAIHLAVNELYLGDSDVVITGGVDTFNDIFMFMCFSKTPALSETGDCRPFSSNADGTILGEGLAMFALKRYDDAVRDHDQIYALIEGVGTSSDGRSKSIYAPVSEGQSKAISRAYEIAGFEPSSIGLIEAHGTGTKAGDIAEFGGLTLAFCAPDTTSQQLKNGDSNKSSENTNQQVDNNFSGDYNSSQCALSRQSIALGSIKSQIGHTKASAGAAGFFKAVLALNHHILPPTIKVEQPNPILNIETTPFYLNTESRPWISHSVRRAGVSSFGFGGSNFHVALQQPPRDHAAKRFHTWNSHLLTFTAETPDDVLTALDSAQSQYDAAVADLTHGSELALYSLARKSHANYNASDRCRLAFVASVETIAERIRQAIQIVTDSPESSLSHPAGIEWGVGDDRRASKIAFLFPGQGSQRLNMGRDLATSFEVVCDQWDLLATEKWNDDIDKPEQAKCRCVADVVFPIPTFNERDANANSDLLHATEWAQPSLGVSSLAALALLRDIGVDADAYAGHSFGEVVALAAGGALSSKDAITVARCRGVLMQQASSNAAASDDVQLRGSMTAVMAAASDLAPYLNGYESDLVIANENAPEQSVLSGSVAALNKVEKRLSDAGITFKRLNVATAFHSNFVKDSVAPFRNFLKTLEISNTTKTVYSNVDAQPYHFDDDCAATGIADQIANAIVLPVRFVDMIRQMVNDGVDLFVEVGAGSVLTRLVQKIDSDVSAVSIDVAGENGVTQLWRTLAFFAKCGVPFDLAKLDARYREEPLPKDGGMRIMLEGGNYMKPYPPENVDEIPGPNHSDLSHYEKISFVNRQPDDQPIKTSNPHSDAEQTAGICFNHTIHNSQRATTTMSDSNQNNRQSYDFSQSQPQSQSVQGEQSAPISADWFYVFQEGQRQMAAAHSAYQDAMAQSHIAFLKAVEATQNNLMSMMAGRPIAPSQPPQTTFRTSQPSPQQSPFGQPSADYRDQTAENYPAQPFNNFANQSHRPQSQPSQQPPPPQQSSQPGSWMSNSGAADDNNSLRHAGSALNNSPGANVNNANSSSVEKLDTSDAHLNGNATLENVLLDVVADKTGYPAEMLDMGMKLEADLGIDSIKRVEILSTVTDAYPNLPEIDTGHMAELTTLGEILKYLSGDQKKNRLTA